jgi:DNA modification methylase
MPKSKKVEMAMIENRILQGDSIDTLKTLPDNSIDCCVTSPPYYLLRNYGNIEGQIGLEDTPKEYIERLLAVFREVRRVLKSTGTLWVVIGDSYNGSGKNTRNSRMRNWKQTSNAASWALNKTAIHGIATKSLIGIPWRFALSMMDCGWILRQDIIWHKINPMPESVRDRFCKSHEYLFMFSKQNKYFFDYKMALESAKTQPNKNVVDIYKSVRDHIAKPHKRCQETPEGQLLHLKRDVWSIGQEQCHEEHYAIFPQKLIEPCILCGCPENGIVLDPFMGSGTTALVAMKQFRKYIGCEINPEYVKIAEKRIADNKGLFD